MNSEEEIKESIESVTELTVRMVHTNKYTYTRWSPENWSIRLGESDEAHYDCEEIEELFQSWFKENTTTHSNKIRWDWTPRKPNKDCPYTSIQGLTNSHFYYQVEWKSWKKYPGYTLYIFSREWSSLNEYLANDDSLDNIKRIAESHYIWNIK